MQTHGVPDLTHDVGHVTAAFSPCVARVRRIPRPLRNYFAKVRERFREFVDEHEVIRVAPFASTCSIRCTATSQATIGNVSGGVGGGGKYLFAVSHLRPLALRQHDSRDREIDV